MKIFQSKRNISWRPIKTLDQQIDVNQDSTNTGSSSPTDHTHSNKALLDGLSKDSHGRLLSSGQIINVPLIQEEW